MVDGPTRIRLAGTDHTSPGGRSHLGGLDALLAAPMVNVDLSLVNSNSNGPALPVLMAVLGTWLNHAWLRADGVKRLLVVEEAWMLVATAQMAALFEELLKFARGPGLSLVAVVHHLSDLSDSTESEALLKMACTRVPYQMKSAEARETGRPGAAGHRRSAVGVLPRRFAGHRARLDGHPRPADGAARCRAGRPRRGRAGGSRRGLAGAAAPHPSTTAVAGTAAPAGGAAGPGPVGNQAGPGAARHRAGQRRRAPAGSGWGSPTPVAPGSPPRPGTAWSCSARPARARPSPS